MSHARINGEAMAKTEYGFGQELMDVTEDLFRVDYGQNPSRDIEGTRFRHGYGGQDRPAFRIKRD